MQSFGAFVLEKLLLQYHDELNQKIFDGIFMRPDARSRFFNVGRKFRDFCGISPENVLDYYFAGSCANYNYTESSDLDIHIVTDFKSEDLMLFYKEKKQEWMAFHDDKFGNYPIEVYVQSSKEKSPLGQGVYSLINNAWIVFPLNQHLDFEHDIVLKRKISYMKHIIDSSIKKDDLVVIHKIKEKIKKIRIVGLNRKGEFDPANLTFKELRNQGYLDKINRFLHEG